MLIPGDFFVYVMSHSGGSGAELFWFYVNVSANFQVILTT